MPTRKAASSDKPYMSEYDKTVEERLQALEEKSHNHTLNGIDEDRVSALESKVDQLIQTLQKRISL